MMYPVGGYYHMPNPVEVRKWHAGTEAEKAGAAAIESNRAARAVVDEVNFVQYEMSRLDGSEYDRDSSKRNVSLDATPKSLNFFQRFTGIGASPVEEIASLSTPKGEQAARVEGVLSDKEMDVTVSFGSGDSSLVYSKVEAEDGTVFFQRGNESVGIDAKGNLVMQSL